MRKIEEVAKAIYEKRNGPNCTSWGLRPKSHKAPYLDDARAAIEAMREPSDGMLEAVISEPKHLYPDRSSDYAEKMKVAVMVEKLAAVTRWQAMIDAALSE